MNCPKCGTHLKEGVLVCPRCGHLLNTADGRSKNCQDIDNSDGYFDIEDKGYDFDGFGDGKRESFGRYEIEEGGGHSRILNLGLLVSTVCLAVGIVIMLLFFIIPKHSISEIDVDSDNVLLESSFTSSELYYEEQEDDDKVEKESESAASYGNSETDAMMPSNINGVTDISVSVTGIEPPIIIENEVVEAAIAKVAADSEEEPNVAEHMIDGNQDTFWASVVNNNVQPIITIDFGTRKDVRIVKVSTYIEEVLNSFDKFGMPLSAELEISGYIFPLRFSNNSMEQYIMLSESVKMSELKLIVRETEGNGCAISEITAYG